MDSTEMADVESVEPGVTDSDYEPGATEKASDPFALLVEACHSPIHAAWVDVEKVCSGGVVTRIEAGLRAHREAMESIGLQNELPSEWESAADGLLEYRKVVVSELLEPLRDFFGSRGPSQVISERMKAAIAEAGDAVDQLPESVQAPWGKDALDRRPSDGLARRIGKVVARGVSSARKAGQERKAPCREIGRRHLARVVVPEEDRAVRTYLADWSQWSRQLEVAWVAWSDKALAALVQFEDPGDDPLAEQWVAVRGAALELDAKLTALCSEARPPDCVEEAARRLGVARGLLAADVSVAGSFLLRDPKESKVGPELKRATRVAPAFLAWDEGVASRMELYRSLLALLSGATAVQRRLSYRFREQCVAPTQALPPIADSLDQLRGEIARAEPLRLDSVRARVGLLLEPAIDAVPAPDEVNTTVEKGAQATVEALLAMVRQAPKSLELHADDAKPPSGARKVEVRSVPFQELARQSFDALRMERIRSSTQGLLAVVDKVRTNVAGLSDVFGFADEAAVVELESDEAEAEARARELVTEALRNMAESLRQGVVDLEVGVSSAQTRLATEVSEGSIGLLDRMAAGRMQAQFLAVRSRISDGRARLNQALGPPVDRAARVLLYRWRVLKRIATRGLRKGTEIVGGVSGEQSESTRAIKALADSNVVTDRLPLVYQRLFTLEALSDAALVAGRATEMSAAMTRWRSWQAGDGVPIVFRGRQGSGVTSVIGTYCAAIEEGGDRVTRISLEERIVEESVLARVLAEALELPAGDGFSLGDVAKAIFRAGPTDLPQAVAVDNLEHLFLRVPGGTDLIERLLTLMAETEPRIFWIGGVTTSAWQLIATGEPTAVSQVDVLELQPLAAAGIREAITLRHKRSGLPMRYEEPKAGRRMLKRRLRRMRDPEAFQTLLADDFFEQMQRTSSGNLRLALFQWQQAADFDAGAGLLMHAPERPNLSVLETLDLTQSFTLKALLEHRTLTLAEHDRIFRLPRQESFQIFESLGNRHLITVVDTKPGGVLDRSEAEVDLRYEVQPLLVGAVISHLESRNIVH